MCRRAPTPLAPYSQQPPIQMVQKPCLARKLVGSAKINLNEYWSVLEAVMDPGRANMENENLDNELRLAKLNIGNNEISSASSNTTNTSTHLRNRLS